MAARRSSRSSSAGGRGRRTSARESAPNNQMGLIIGGLVVVVVVLVGVMTMTGKTKDPAETDSPGTSAKKEEPKSTPKVDRVMPAAKGGQEPDTPAPNLTPSVIDKADAYYVKAKKLNDEARVVQSTGDNKKFNRLVNESWETLEHLDKFIETYTDWLEEADLGDWRLPAEYVKLQQRLGVYDKLRGRLRRVKATKQK